jgi:hypothetical protein
MGGVGGAGREYRLPPGGVVLEAAACGTIRPLRAKKPVRPARALLERSTPLDLKRRALHSGRAVFLAFFCMSVRGADVALHLSATASSADIDEVVTVVLVTTGVAPGTPITLYSPQGAHLWHGLPDCAGPDRSKTTFPSSASSEFLCLSSSRAQSLRAVASVKLPSGALLTGSSETIKFAGDPWWKSTIVVSGIVALVGAIWGLASTLIAQNHERRRKAADEKAARVAEQEQFLVRNLLPELAQHLQILRKNDALVAGQEKDVESLPKGDLVTVMGEPRAQQLASYFTSLRLKDVLPSLQTYSEEAGKYNIAAENVRRNKLGLAALAQQGDALRTQLGTLGFVD